MKLLLLSLSFLWTGSLTVAFQPYRIRYEDLFNFDNKKDRIENEGFLHALTETGILSVTDLPEKASIAMDTMMKLQHDCIIKSIQDEGTGQVHQLADGTTRSTIATHTVPGNGGMQPAFKSRNKSNIVDDTACDEFEHSAKVFRKSVHSTVGAFAERVSELLPANERPLLQTKTFTSEEAPNHVYRTFQDIVENGEHLEHFHSYEKWSNDTLQTKTIEFHTDQGLFLTFTPGRRTTGELTDGFFIQLKDGSIESVEFTKEDSLVILLGDGVNQYVNQNSENAAQLRAAPHALQLKANEIPRIWYGRMVLPPADAVHPAHGKTFQELRQGLVHTAGPEHEDAVRLACSNAYGSATDIDRMLQDTTCENEEEIYCWHRCMNTTLYDVSELKCEASFQTLQCINPRDQISTGENHGDYFPGCVDADAPVETPFPTLPEYPRDDTACTMFDDFVNEKVYENEIGLGNATFQWTVQDDGIVKGRIAFDGIFGYLAVGFAGVGGRYAMHDAPILMALRGGDYSAKTGMDLNSASSIEEYRTDPEATTFRIWGTPYKEETDVTVQERNAGRRKLSDKSVEWDGCYTALLFEMDGFAGQKFNITGTDKMIWAANNVDTYVQYHGMNRGIFDVTWMSSNDDNANSNDGKKEQTSAGTLPFYVCSLYSLLVVLFYFYL